MKWRRQIWWEYNIQKRTRRKGVSRIQAMITKSNYLWLWVLFMVDNYCKMQWIFEMSQRKRRHQIKMPEINFWFDNYECHHHNSFHNIYLMCVRLFVINVLWGSSIYRVTLIYSCGKCCLDKLTNIHHIHSMCSNFFSEPISV